MPSGSSPTRRSSRLNLTCVVRISGQLRQHAPYDEDAAIVTVSKYGAKLKTDIPLQVGMMVKVKPLHGKNSAALRVVWVGRDNSPHAGTVGVECAEGIGRILGIYFPDTAGQPEQAGQLVQTEQNLKPPSTRLEARDLDEQAKRGPKK